MSRLLFRPASPGDFLFVEHSFLDSYRDSHAAGLIPMDRWHDVMRPFWLRILARPGVVVTVASWPDVLAGWIAVERDYEVPTTVVRFGKRARRMIVCRDPLVIYVYVKQAYRRHGIARSLFRAAGVDLGAPFRYATRNALVAGLVADFPQARFDPLIVRYPKETHGSAHA